MRAIGVLLVFVSIIILGFSVVFPRNLGERTPVWEVKERFFGDAYRELRSEYFISMNMEQQWRDQNNILFIWNDGDVFRITEVYLKVKKEIANNCKITSSGIIEWKRNDLGKRILADALTDTPLRVLERHGDAEYSLDKTEDSIKEFEEATGIKADELLDTVSLIRKVYGETLNKLIEMRYQELRAMIKKSVIRVIIMWGIYAPIWGIVRTAKKKYQKEIDKSMKDFI